MEKYNGKGANATNPEKIPITVYVPIRDDIRQLYELIHEVTHTFDIENGDTPTRRVLGEVAPQCMERLLDDFLLEMSDEDMKKYGFNRNKMEQDIKDRKISTFLSRFNNAQALYRGSRNRELDSRYMLAQIYSAHFNKFDKLQKKNKLVSFIKCVSDDKFDMANNAFSLSIDRKANLNRFYRDNYVGFAISEAVNLITTKTQSKPIQYQKELENKERD